jgi:glycosyltransferase involved in cell wall biosynthesis
MKLASLKVRMSLNQITPVLLTYDEEANIGRTLDRLGWARDIVVVDSFSTDGTVYIARTRPCVRLFQRIFDNHAQQWNYAIQETNINTEWILALDADYFLTDDFIQELVKLAPEPDINSYCASFTYCVRGKPLRGTLYPPVRLLFRKGKAHYVQDGHTQRVQVEGRTANMRSKILHDDRKSLSKWLQAQDRYMQLEAEQISQTKVSELGTADRLRRRFPLLFPFLAFFYCFLVKGGCLDGKPGIYYAMQRFMAEALLGLRLIEKSSRGEAP